MDPVDLTYFFYALSVALLIGVFWLGLKLIRMDRMRKEFFASGLKKDLEQILIDQNRMLSQLQKNLKEHDDSINLILNDNRSNFQKMGFVRFNPFDDSGGNISFAVALLNDHNDGVVISSLHGREGTRVYAKTITSGLSESKLTDEELQAIKNAK